MPNETVTDPNRIVVKYNEDAENVLAAMRDVLKRFTFVSVGDLLDLVGLPSTYVDSKRGWRSLESVTIKAVPEGYSLVLPPTEEF